MSISLGADVAKEGRNRQILEYYIEIIKIQGVGLSKNHGTSNQFILVHLRQLLQVDSCRRRSRLIQAFCNLSSLRSNQETLLYFSFLFARIIILSPKVIAFAMDNNLNNHTDVVLRFNLYLEGDCNTSGMFTRRFACPIWRLRFS